MRDARVLFSGTHTALRREFRAGAPAKAEPDCHIANESAKRYGRQETVEIMPIIPYEIRRDVCRTWRGNRRWFTVKKYIEAGLCPLPYSWHFVHSYSWQLLTKGRLDVIL
jgi:hypothetical protein